jgi:subtilisin
VTTELTVAVREEGGQPVAGACVVLDQRWRRTTDPSGIVRLPLPVPIDGEEHQLLAFRALDFKPLLLILPAARLAAADRIEIRLETQPPPPIDGVGQWLRDIGADRPAPPGAENVRIGVMDTGIERSHPCLNVAGGFAAIGNGDGSARPVSPHGTFAAGLMGGRPAGGKGVVGVVPGATLYDLRVFDRAGVRAPREAIIRGIEWAVNNAIEVICVGFGAGEPDLEEETAWRRAESAGIVVVAPAGNTADERRDVLYPAGYDSTICVAAVSPTEGVPSGGNPEQPTGGRWLLSSFSCRGPEVEVVAPGAAICSIVPSGISGRVQYDYCSGTSEAACLAAGAAVRLLAAHPELRAGAGPERPRAVRALLRSHALPLGIESSGAGLVRCV